MSKWFYLIDVAADLEIVAGVLGLEILIATAIITAICFSEAYDEEEVVRCRDCKHCVLNPKKVWGICYRHGVFVKLMDYCSGGQRE